MAVERGTRFNTSGSNSFTKVPLNASTSTTIKAEGNDFLHFSVFNPDNQDVVIKLQAALVDDVKEGLVKLTKGGFWEMTSNQNYLGEICAIAMAGTPDLWINKY